MSRQNPLSNDYPLQEGLFPPRGCCAIIRIKGNQKAVEEAILFWFENRLKDNAKADAKTVEKERSDHYPGVVYL